MSARIDGSRAVVTGAGSGIGRATAVHLARRGAEVLTADIDLEAAAETAARCRELGAAAESYHCDVGEYEAVAELARRIESERGPVDIVVNNAGVGLAGPFLESEIEDWRWLRRVNLDGMVHGCHAFGRGMAARRRGHLVNIASLAGYVAHGQMAAYCTSKAAVIMFSQCLRAELRSHGVGVSAICPGVINTPIPHHTRMVGEMAGRRQRAARAFSHGHPPEAVAKAIASAIEHNRELVTVGAEAAIAHRLLRMAPGPVRGALARLPLG